MDDYKDIKTIIQTLEELVKKKDIDRLELEIPYYTKLINNINNPQVYKTHVITCVFLKRYDLAINSLKRINKFHKNSDELTAMIYYSNNEYSNALRFFENITTYMCPNTSILIKSLCEWECGDKDISEHESKLQKICEVSVNANTFLGTINYNDENYYSAAEYYIQAVLLSNYSEKSRLNSLRALYQINKNDAEKELPRFFYETESKLTVNEINIELNKKLIGIPYLVLNNFHETAKNMLK